MSIVAQELDYGTHTISHGSYQYSKVTQQTGTTTVDINTGGNDSIFELPPKVYNFAKFILSFTMTTVAPGANDRLNWVHVDGIPMIRQIQLYTRSGLYLVDIQNFNYYMNMIGRRTKKIEDVVSYDTAGSSSLGVLNTIQCINTLTYYRPTVNRNIGTATTLNYARNYLQPQYLIYGDATTNSPTPVLKYQIEFSNISECLLGMDRDLYFGGEILYLRVVWDSAAKIGYRTDVAAADFPPTNATNTLANPTALASVALSDLVLYVPIEQNPVIENTLKQKIISDGLNVLIPYVNSNIINVNAATTQNLSVKYSRPYGSKLLKIYWAPYLSGGAANTVYDHNCKSGAKIVTFYTIINNVRTSQLNYALASYEDYFVQKNKLKGSCILSSDEYYYNWVWVEDFTNNNPLSLQSPVPEENIVDGLDLNTEIKYDIYATTANEALNHYLYAITQRNLVINNAGINLM